MILNTNSKNPHFKPLNVDPRRNFDTLHKVPEIDYVLDTLKDYFARRYNIDYMGINMLNSNHDFIITKYDYDPFHVWLTKNIPLNYDEVILHKIHLLKPHQSLFSDSDPLISDREISTRAELFGTRKYGIWQLTLSNEWNDKTIYHVTFKDDIYLSQLSKQVFDKLINDLKKSENVLKLFIEHGSKYENFTDKMAMSMIMDQWKKDFAFLL